MCVPVCAYTAALWVTDEHQLSAEQLGVASTAIGVAELVGEILVILNGNFIRTCQSNFKLNACLCTARCAPDLDAKQLLGAILLLQIPHFQPCFVALSHSSLFSVSLSAT